MSAGYISVIMGSILIIVGIVMVAYQMRKVSWSRPPQRSADISTKGITLKTTYPGITVIGIGAVMVMAGAITAN